MDILAGHTRGVPMRSRKTTCVKRGGQVPSKRSETLSHFYYVGVPWAQEDKEPSVATPQSSPDADPSQPPAAVAVGRDDDVGDALYCEQGRPRPTDRETQMASGDTVRKGKARVPRGLL